MQPLNRGEAQSWNSEQIAFAIRTRDDEIHDIVRWQADQYTVIGRSNRQVVPTYDWDAGERLILGLRDEIDFLMSLL